MVTVDGELLSDPLFVINCATYVPGRSAKKVGVAEVGFVRVARLFGGAEMRAHWNVRGSPWGSVPEPCKVTVRPCRMVWLGPAFAVGGCGVPVVMVTVAAQLLTLPSLTINWATNVPALSAVNVGL